MEQQEKSKQQNQGYYNIYMVIVRDLCISLSLNVIYVIFYTFKTKVWMDNTPNFGQKMANG